MFEKVIGIVKLLKLQGMLWIFRARREIYHRKITIFRYYMIIKLETQYVIYFMKGVEKALFL